MLKQKIQEDLIAALKNKDQLKLNTLRFVTSRIKNQEIEKKADLNDEEVIIILKKFAKELKESIEASKKANRQELVNENQKQLAIVSTYLPEEISDDQLKHEIEKIIADNKALYDQNPKAIIGLCMKSLKSKADPSRIIKVLNTYVNH
ncbi:MAG: GatB/YqeY domain-containing protein [Microgenomates group bacterium]